MDERKDLLDIINRYIDELNQIKYSLDEELNNRYFRLSCMASDMECNTVYLNKKYHKKEWKEEID